MTPTQKQSFEDSLPVINERLLRSRDQWKLSSLSWIDYDDISQIIRIHIYNQWDKYDQRKPFIPWLNAVIRNQIKNLVRNNFSNYARPCLRCPAAQSDDSCELYGSQCDDCGIFKAWQQRKQAAYNIKVPVALEFHGHDTAEPEASSENLPVMVDSLNKIMKQELSPSQWRVYESIYIKGEDELEVAKKLGYRTNEKNRSPGYKQIKNIQKLIILKAKKCIYDGMVDFI